DLCRRALGRGHDLDPARHQGKIRIAPWRAHYRRCHRRGSDPRQPLHHRPFLPDKAIDLMDEASARLRMTIDSKPEELDELDRRVVQLKIEREALKKETDPASRERLQRLEQELTQLEQQSAELTGQWQAEKQKLASAQKIKEQLEQARIELEQVQRRGDWTRAGELAYGIIPDLEKRLAEAETKEGRGMLGEEAVTPER